MLDLSLFQVLPFPFWVTICLFGYGAVRGFKELRSALGIPILAVLATTAAWYVGDVFYNDYVNTHKRLFETNILLAAWWELAFFVFVFIICVLPAHRVLNSTAIKLPSQVFKMLRLGTEFPELQHRIEQVLGAAVLVFSVLLLVAVLRVGSDIQYYLFPFLGLRVDPWARDRIGVGFDALLSFAAYAQLFTAGVFGLVAALASKASVRSLALIGCFFTWPYYFLDRTRNTLLVAVLPSIIAWVFLRLRVGLFAKCLVLCLFFILMNAWMSFIIDNRTNTTIAAALVEKGFTFRTEEKIHHEGLNMFEELCWINSFIESGTYTPNWGRRYLAELVNPVPRSLWAGKPLVGIDYAIARGFANNDSASAGVNASISTGMIGQGVVNFGRLLGPAFAALLMSIWAAVLARLDLHGYRIGRLPLYAFGLVLTFNLGRDITFLTLYTFVFGILVVGCLERFGAASIAKPHLGLPKRGVASRVKGRAGNFVTRRSGGVT